MRNIRDRRDPNRRVSHITNRTWTGLPFVPNHLTNRMLLGVLARAQYLYPVTIVAVLFMGNHYHLILAGRANLTSRFMEYVDGEIAKRLQRLFPGRFGPHVWEERYKEQSLPTPEAVIKKIIYLFCNPMKAKLEACLALYPGLNSSSSLKSSDHSYSKLCSFTFSRFFKPLKRRKLSQRDAIAISRDLHAKRECFHELKIDLFAWRHCFQEKLSIAEYLEEINSGIQAAEYELQGKGVVGRKRLIGMSLYHHHKPEKKGITPFIDCPDIQLRKKLIESYKEFRRQCKEAWNRVKQGIPAVWPRGAFVPVMLERHLAPPLTGFL